MTEGGEAEAMTERGEAEAEGDERSGQFELGLIPPELDCSLKLTFRE